MIEIANTVPRCSICLDKVAVSESVAHSGTYYCLQCSNYIAVEYGESRLKAVVGHSVGEKLTAPERKTK